MLFSTLPLGTSTAQVRPALPAYAAALALVLPVEAHTTAFEPSSTALLIASVIPRSLKEAVGFAPSYFSQTSQPVSADSGAERTSGVPPSHSVTTGVVSVTGSRSRYSSMMPRHGCATPTPRPRRAGCCGPPRPRVDRAAWRRPPGTRPREPGA